MGSLRPLSEIMPQQTYQPQPQPQMPVQQAPQYPQQQLPPQQYQQAPQQQVPQGNTQVFGLQSTAQLDQMRNNGRVEIVVQDAQAGYQVISSDALNIASIERQNGQLAQELRLFDVNNDGWIVEAELQAHTVGQVPVQQVGEQPSTFEHVASSTLGGGLFGSAVGGLASRMGMNIGSKFGVKGWVAGMAVGAAAGLVGGFMTKPKAEDNQQQNYAGTTGYRVETQWSNNRLIKTIL
ncbi:MAG: hypothetical protein IGS03_10105 [Candidatus Sericytochromatia bacterium]|nr:hypothetical protein [Candidatus Sericytochromatia bacterium]